MPISTRAVTRRSTVGLVERSACQLLRLLAGEVPAEQAIVELGAFQGRSTGWLLAGAAEGNRAHVTTVDTWKLRRGQQYVGGSPRFANAYNRFKEHMRAIGATRAELTVRRAYATEVAAGWTGPPVGLLWHDAGHSEQEVADDLAAWLPHMAPVATIVAHDACRADYGVLAGAAKVLAGAPGWDWEGRQIVPWQRRPSRRGLLIVRRQG